MAIGDHGPSPSPPRFPNKVPSLPPHSHFLRASWAVSCQDGGSWQCPITPGQPLPLGPTWPMVGTRQSYSRARCTKSRTWSPEEAQGGPAEHRSWGPPEAPLWHQCRSSFHESWGWTLAEPSSIPSFPPVPESGLRCLCTTVGGSAQRRTHACLQESQQNWA